MLESLLNKVAGLSACNFIKKRLQHRCFPVTFAKYSRTPFLQNTSGGYASGNTKTFLRLPIHY